MTVKITILIFLMTWIFLLKNCGKTTELVDSSNIADYIPLKIGNKWHYQIYGLDQNGHKRPFYPTLDSILINHRNSSFQTKNLIT